VDDLVNPQQLDQHHEDPHPEIQIARGCGAHGRGQRQTPLAKHKHKGTFALQNEIGNLPMAGRDHQAKKKSRNFEWHIEILRRTANRLNRPKTLIERGSAPGTTRLSVLESKQSAMNPELQKLMELQQVDARIAALRAEVAALPKEVAAIEAKLAGSKAKVETAQTSIKTDEGARRKHESDIKDQQEKISKYRDQSLKVKTNQEYKALLTEIEHAEKEIARLEDKILEIMVAADTRKETLKQAEATLKADTAENEKEKEHARKQTAEDEQALAELTEQRKQLRGGIDDDTLRHYDRVLKLRGSALAAVHDDQMCSVCRVILRPQVYQDVMKGEEILACDSCQRILYFVPPPPKEDAPKRDAAKKGTSSSSSGDIGEQESLETAELPAGEAAAQ